MKKVFFLFALTGIFCLSTVASAQTVLSVNVPFEFVVRGKTLPAASYLLKRPISMDNTGIAFVGDGEYVQIRASAMDATLRGARLEFLKIGEKYFLTDVVTPTGTLHYPLSRKQEGLVMNGQTAGTSIAASE